MIQSIIDQVWDSLTSWIPPQLLTPEFLWWVSVITPAALILLALAFFAPMFRSAVGAIVLASIAFLVGQWMGIGYAAARQRQKDEQARKAAQQPQQQFKIPWPFG